MGEKPNSDEGADPSADIKAQNPDEKTTADQANDEPTKTQDLAKAGRDDFDPNAGQE